MLAAAALVANTVILLSDRAPGMFRRLSDRLDVGTVRAAAAQVTPGGDLPRSDFVIHVTLWAVAGLAVLSGRAVVRVVPLGLVRRLAGCALAVLAVAAAVEAIRG